MEAAANVDEGKVVLMIDTDLAGINEKNAAEKVNDIVKLFARINSRRENKILNRFLKDLEVIADSGEELAERARNITGAGKIFPKNIIAITTSSNSEKLSDLAGINVTAIDDKGFEKDDYLPLTEVMLFTFGKYLKWDKEMLLMCYNLIPTAVSIDKLDEEEREALLTDTITSVIIHLIPNAIEFEEGELVGTYARIEMIVQNA